MTEYTIEYYSQQIEKVKLAQDSARSQWSQQWLSSLEQRLRRKLEWRLVDISANRSYTIDTTALEER
jgi:hypothetical protein